MYEQIIELYSRTGRSQAGKLLIDVISDTGIPFRKESLHCFGCWTWDYNDINKDLWRQALPALKKRITKLFLEGVIISGRWGY